MSAAVNSRAREIIRLAKPGLDKRKDTSQSPLGRQEHGMVRRRFQAPEPQHPPDDRLKIAVREMEPVEIGGKIGMVRSELQPAASVFGDDVFDDGAGFGEEHSLVLDDGRGAERVQALQFGRRKDGHGIALVKREFVRNAKLLAEPHDPLRLRMTEVVDSQHEWLSAGRICPPIARLRGATTGYARLAFPAGRRCRLRFRCKKLTASPRQPRTEPAAPPDKLDSAGRSREAASPWRSRRAFRRQRSLPTCPSCWPDRKPPRKAEKRQAVLRRAR